jgi:hypothetical protein
MQLMLDRAWFYDRLLLVVLGMWQGLCMCFPVLLQTARNSRKEMKLRSGLVSYYFCSVLLLNFLQANKITAKMLNYSILVYYFRLKKILSQVSQKGLDSSALVPMSHRCEFWPRDT